MNSTTADEVLRLLYYSKRDLAKHSAHKIASRRGHVIDVASTVKRNGMYQKLPNDQSALYQSRISDEKHHWDMISMSTDLYVHILILR